MPAGHYKRTKEIREKSSKGGKLSFVDNPENGITLCWNCHQETKHQEEWWEKKWNYIKELNEYLLDMYYDTAR